MGLKEQILEDIKTAMKAKEDFARDTLRQISAALKQIEVDTRKVLSDDEIVAVLQKEVKKRQDAIALYLQGGREELAKKEQDEIQIISKYLPAQLDDEALKEAIAKIKDELADAVNLGLLIKTAKEKLGASAEARRISEVAKSLLS